MVNTYLMKTESAPSLSSSAMAESCCRLPERQETGFIPSEDAGRPPAVSQEPADGRRGDIVWFSGGVSSIGTDSPVIAGDGEGPRRQIRLASFGLEKHAVSNRRFAAFVAETGYRTEAERFGWSFVFHLFVRDGTMTAQPVGLPWWHQVAGACWNAPEGPGTGLDGRLDHPVVHVSANDARAFADWAGGRLPSEAEWEHAARAGRPDVRYPWGDAEPDDRTICCNIWQGRFPHENSALDGYVGTAPVEAFQPNPAGLYNMSGNVWEWTADRFHIPSSTQGARHRNAEARASGDRVLKGGSYLCHISYCYRYRIAARIGHSADTSTGHIGFRVAYTALG